MSGYKYSSYKTNNPDYKTKKEDNVKELVVDGFTYDIRLPSGNMYKAFNEAQKPDKFGPVYDKLRETHNDKIEKDPDGSLKGLGFPNFPSEGDALTPHIRAIRQAFVDTGMGWGSTAGCRFWYDNLYYKQAKGTLYYLNTMYLSITPQKGSTVRAKKGKKALCETSKGKIDYDDDEDLAKQLSEVSLSSAAAEPQPANRGKCELCDKLVLMTDQRIKFDEARYCHKECYDKKQKPKKQPVKVEFKHLDKEDDNDKGKLKTFLKDSESDDDGTIYVYPVDEPDKVIAYMDDDGDIYHVQYHGYFRKDDTYESTEMVNSYKYITTYQESPERIEKYTKLKNAYEKLTDNQKSKFWRVDWDDTKKTPMYRNKFEEDDDDDEVTYDATLKLIFSRDRFDPFDIDSLPNYKNDDFAMDTDSRLPSNNQKKQKAAPLPAPPVATSSSLPPAPPAPAPPKPEIPNQYKNEWQAVLSKKRNRYYFFNSQTGENTYTPPWSNKGGKKKSKKTKKNNKKKSKKITRKSKKSLKNKKKN